MKRSWRWYLAWGTMLASMSMLFLIATAGPAMAWTQEYNTFAWDPNTNQYVGNPICGGDQSHPCMYWQEPYKASIFTQRYWWRNRVSFHLLE